MIAEPIISPDFTIEDIHKISFSAVSVTKSIIVLQGKVDYISLYTICLNKDAKCAIL